MHNHSYEIENLRHTARAMWDWPEFVPKIDKHTMNSNEVKAATGK
jgi:hypothetical protein